MSNDSDQNQNDVVLVDKSSVGGDGEEDDTNRLLYRTSTRFMNQSSVTSLDDDFKSLQNTVDSALGTPEIGAVNFNHLHHVLTTILQHLCKYIYIF